MKRIKRIKKDYPEIKTDMGCERLREELIKYEELYKVSKNIDLKKEEHISDVENNIKKLSIKEKIEFLQRESEFWNLVTIEEKYKDANILEEHKVKQKRMNDVCQKNQK